MNLGLGLVSGADDVAGLQREINSNLDILNAKALGVMEWCRISGTAAGAGPATFAHSLGRKPDMVILYVNVTGITWYITDALQASWTESSAAVALSGACNFSGFAGKFEDDSLS